MQKFSSTMKASSRRTSRNKKLQKVAMLGVVVLALLFLVPRLFGLAASTAFVPITHFETWLFESGATLPTYFRDRRALLEEIQTLQQKMVSVQSTQNTITRLQSENSELRKIIGGKEEIRTAAAVIGRPGVTPYDTLILDKGRSDGIVEHAPVYIGADTAIGYVAAVFDTTSVVTLATTPHFESTVYIIGPNIYTTARGIGGGVLEVSVPQGIALTIGDLVVIPSFDSGVYGTIDVIDSIPSEPEQRAYVTLDIPLQSLRFVSIGHTPVSEKTFEEAAVVVSEVKKNLLTVPVPLGMLVDVDTATGTATATVQEEAGSEE